MKLVQQFFALLLIATTIPPPIQPEQVDVVPVSEPLDALPFDGILDGRAAIDAEAILPEAPIVAEEPLEPIVAQEPHEPIVAEEPQEPIVAEEPQEPIVEEPQEPIAAEEPIVKDSLVTSEDDPLVGRTATKTLMEPIVVEKFVEKPVHLEPIPHLHNKPLVVVKHPMVALPPVLEKPIHISHQHTKHHPSKLVDGVQDHIVTHLKDHSKLNLDHDHHHHNVRPVNHFQHIKELANAHNVPLPKDLDADNVNRIIAVGKNLASVLTAKLTAPGALHAAKTTALVSALPSILASKGALLGSLIAKPMVLKVSALSALHAASKALVVTVPVAIGTGVAAGAVHVKDTLGKVDLSKVHSGLSHLKNGALTFGRYMIKPALVTAAGKTALVGGAVSALGHGTSSLGAALKSAGGHMSTGGAHLKSASGELLSSSLGHLRSHPLLKWLWTRAKDGQVYVVDTPFVQIIKSSTSKQVDEPLNVKEQHVQKDVLAHHSQIDALKQHHVHKDSLKQQHALKDDLKVEEPMVEEYFLYKLNDDKVNVKGRKRRSVGEDVQQPSLELDTAMRLLKMAGIEDCIGRVICELACDLGEHGVKGELVFRNLLDLQVSGHVRKPEFDYYRSALIHGRRFGSSRFSKNCKRCSVKYANCKALTSDLLDVASLVKLH